MKILVLIFLCFFSPVHAFTLTEYQKTPKNQSHLNTVINRYPQDQLIKNLRSFASCCRPSRLVGLPGNEQAGQFIEEFLKKRSSGEIQVHTFEFSASSPELNTLHQMQKKYLEGLYQGKSKNFIWEKKGIAQSESSEILIFSAYYDNLTIDQKNQSLDTTSVSLGADNNASGVGALLSLVEILDVMPIQKTVRVVFHNYGLWNEFGLKQYFLQHQKQLQSFQKIHHLQVQTIGHSQARTHRLNKENQLKLYYSSQKEKALAQNFLDQSAFAWGANELSIGQAQERDAFGLKEVPHASHLILSGDREMDPNPRHFSTDDFVETINTSFYAQNFKILSAIAIRWAFNLEN